MLLVFFRPNDNIKLNYHFDVCHNTMNRNYDMELLNNRLMFLLCVFTDSIYGSINKILFYQNISIPIYYLEIKSILELLTQCLLHLKIYMIVKLKVVCSVHLFLMRSWFNALLGNFQYLELKDFKTDPYRNRRDRTKILNISLTVSS